VETSFYSLTLPLSDWNQVCYSLRRQAYDLLQQAAEFGVDSKYGAILYSEHMAITAIAESLELRLPDPEDAT
jgi:hypothetical protein